MTFHRENSVVSYTCMHPKTLQLCLTLWNPTNHNPPGSSVHGIFQARILEWVGHILLQDIFSIQGSNPCHLHLLHWQAGSLPLVPPEKPHQVHTMAIRTSAQRIAFFITMQHLSLQPINLLVLNFTLKYPVIKDSMMYLNLLFYF